jgi:hypothetical protein
LRGEFPYRLSIGDDTASLNRARDILASVETLVHTQGWLPTKARLRLQKVRLLLKLRDFESAASELIYAWRDAVRANARQYIEESLRIVAQEPKLCKEELLNLIAESHGPCTYCSPNYPSSLASCALQTLAIREALSP